VGFFFNSLYNFLPLAAWPFSRNVFGNRPSPQILNDPKSLYQSPSATSGFDSTKMIQVGDADGPVAHSIDQVLADSLG